MKLARGLVTVGLSLMLSLVSVLGASEVVDAGLDTIFTPLMEVVRPFFVKLSFVVGGIFGATILLVLARMYYDRKTVKLLKAIKFDLDQVNKYLGITYSFQRKGFIEQLIERWRDRSHRKTLKQLHRFKTIRQMIKEEVKRNENNRKS